MQFADLCIIFSGLLQLEIYADQHLVRFDMCLPELYLRNQSMLTNHVNDNS